MKSLFSAALAAYLLAGVTAQAQTYTLGELTIERPTAFETPKMAMAGGGFLAITNDGARDDRLIEIRADFPKVELHTTEEQDGVARMMHIETLVIPAGETVRLQPGGLHVMFMGLRGKPLVAGESFPATLVFETTGKIEVVFEIVARGAQIRGTGAGAGHGTDDGADR